MQKLLVASVLLCLLVVWIKTNALTDQEITNSVQRATVALTQMREVLDELDQVKTNEELENLQYKLKLAFSWLPLIRTNAQSNEMELLYSSYERKLTSAQNRINTYNKYLKDSTEVDERASKENGYYTDVNWNTMYFNGKRLSYSETQRAVLWMYNNSLTDFQNAYDFNGDGQLTREQAAKFFTQFALKILQRDMDEGSILAPSDLKQISESLKGNVLLALSQGIFKGDGGKFYPQNKLTRAQAIAVLIRTKDWSLDESGKKRYEGYYNKALDYGVVGGLNFDYNTLDKVNITRREMALMLYRIANY
mgnify:FL=1